MHFGSVCSGKSRTGRPAIDLLGQRFGRLLVVERVENDKRVDRLKSDATPAELRLVLDYMEGRR